MEKWQIWWARCTARRHCVTPWSYYGTLKYAPVYLFTRVGRSESSCCSISGSRDRNLHQQPYAEWCPGIEMPHQARLTLNVERGLLPSNFVPYFPPSNRESKWAAGGSGEDLLVTRGLLTKAWCGVNNGHDALHTSLSTIQQLFCGQSMLAVDNSFKAAWTLYVGRSEGEPDHQKYDRDRILVRNHNRM